MLKRLFDNIKSNILLKLASFNSVSVVIRIISGFITSKVIAIYVGAEGLALIGNFRNFVSSVQSVSGLGTYSGLVKYVAEYKKKPKQLITAVSTTSILVFVTTFVVSCVCFFFSNFISIKLFDTSKYTYLIKILALVLPFYSLNRIILSLINGFFKFKLIIKLNILSQITAGVITVALIVFNKINGALIAVAISESLIVVFTLLIALKHNIFSTLLYKKAFNLNFVKKISAYSGMALFSAIVLPLLMVFIRNYITDHVGLKEAGFWEAMNRISNYYLMFMSTLIGMYILPRFSEINTDKEFRSEIWSFYKSLMPVFALGLIVVYFLRHLIIKIVLTEEFMPVQELFFWQLLGDFVKVLSVVVASQFMAKRLFWPFIIAETISVISLYLFSMFLIDAYGVVGANMAHFFNYLVYYAVVLFFFRKSLFSLSK